MEAVNKGKPAENGGAGPGKKRKRRKALPKQSKAADTTKRATTTAKPQIGGRKKKAKKLAKLEQSSKAQKETEEAAKEEPEGKEVQEPENKHDDTEMQENGGGESKEDEERDEAHPAESEDNDSEQEVGTELSRVLTYKNRERVLILATRGITHRERHLMNDLRRLLPHSRKEGKLDIKDNFSAINEIAEEKSCNNCIFFESRKHKDLYMWICKTPNGPGCKFLVQNIHTMSELNLTGNCLKGSRPFLSFDKTFDTQPHWQLIRELLLHSFNTPRHHRKSKPFMDHVFMFSIQDNKIWFRNYQLVENDQNERSLVEIGPRFVLDLVRIFEGSFGGPTLYANAQFVNPNLVRSMAAKKHAQKSLHRKKSIQQQQEKKEKLVLPPDELASVFSV